MLFTDTVLHPQGAHAPRPYIVMGIVSEESPSPTLFLVSFCSLFLAYPGHKHHDRGTLGSLLSEILLDRALKT